MRCSRIFTLCITARTKEDALKLKEILKESVHKRGLKLSEEKTKIVNTKDGFDFISRFYYKADGRIRCVPSQKAVDKFKEEMKFLIFNNKNRWTIKEMIDSINRKITGFVTYHKVEESKEAFTHLDVIINAFLLRMVKEMHPTYTINQLKSRYWIKDCMGRFVFTTPDKRNRCVKNMADTILVNEKQIDLKKNVFLDRDYFIQLENNKAIQNVTGRYKRVYDLQEGKCYFCSKEIKPTDEKKIIFKNTNKDKTIKNMAYIHEDCNNQMLTKVKVNDDVGTTITVRELFKQITDEKRTSRKDSKFKNLMIYFHDSKKKKIKLSFATIEKILGFKLCDSAYKYRSYFFNKNKGMISETWISQGFIIESLDMEKEEIVFKRVIFKKKINIPTALYRTNLPVEAVEEANYFFMHFMEKYGLK